ncbi:MAG: NAD(P)/FAD-dependent oxidoreductase [Archangium sp.]
MLRLVHWDAIVIGGGPAGSSAATWLSRAGRKVLLLEKEQFPREHIGESLLPGVLPYLDSLGVRDAVEAAGFEKKEGQTLVWGGDGEPWHIDFRELDVFPYSFFVERARFDELLLRHSAASGTTVRERCAVKEIVFEKGRAIGVRLDSGENLSASFIIDASGQSALTARGGDLIKPVAGLKNVALWAYWENAKRLPAPRRQNFLTASIRDGWIWVIPLGDKTSIGVVTSHRSQSARSKEGPLKWYERTLREAGPVAPLLEGATRVSDLRGARDWSYRAKFTSGPGILLIGDAACFIDPILSTGVHLAMSAAYWAAAAVHSSLGKPEHEPMFRRYFDESYAAQYHELLAQVSALYRTENRKDSYYWTSKEILRLGAAVEPRLAFLHITAGLLRNAAFTKHDTAAGVKTSLGERANLPSEGGLSTSAQRERTAQNASERGGADGASHERALPPAGESRPLVWRTGAIGAAELVSVRADGLQLRVVRHEPRGLRDRPAETWCCIEVRDDSREPIALAVLEERRRGVAGAGRVEVSVIAYSQRPVSEAVRAAFAHAVAGCDDPKKPLAMDALEKAVRRAVKLPAGVACVPEREHRGSSVAEPPLTAVFDTPPGSPLERLYVMVEARVPPKLSELPMLRTRWLDVFHRPSISPGWAEPFLAAVTKKLWSAVQGADSRAEAFDRAERALGELEFSGFSRLALGRLSG